MSSPLEPIGDSHEAGIIDHETIPGRSVVLEPLEPVHTPAIIDAALGGQSIFEQFRTRELATEDDVRAWAAQHMREVRSDDDRPFVVLDAASGRALGCVWVANVRQRHRRCRLGQLWFAPEHAESDQALEALVVMTTNVLDIRGMERISLSAAVDDPSVIRLIERLGATAEGVLRRFVRRDDGSAMDVVAYSLLAEEAAAALAEATAAIGGPVTEAEGAAALDQLEQARGSRVELPLPQQRM